MKEATEIMRIIKHRELITVSLTGLFIIDFVLLIIFISINDSFGWSEFGYLMLFLVTIIGIFALISALIEEKTLMQTQSTIELEFIDAVRKYDLSYSLTQNLIELCKYLQFSNGCGAQDGMKFPSTIYGVSIRPACTIHDIEWHVSENYKELLQANENFDNNLKKITDAESANKFMGWLRRARVHKYVDAVELVGTPAYARAKGYIFSDED